MSLSISVDFDNVNFFDLRIRRKTAFAVSETFIKLPKTVHKSKWQKIIQSIEQSHNFYYADDFDPDEISSETIEIKLKDHGRTLNIISGSYDDCISADVIIRIKLDHPQDKLELLNALKSICSTY